MADPGLFDPQRTGVEPLKHHNGGLSTDGADPKLVKALARRIIRPLRERAKLCGWALAVHGSLARDIDLVAVPWTDRALTEDQLAGSLKQVLAKMYPIELEIAPGAGQPKPHGRLCWSWWIRPWTYVDLSIFPRPCSCSGDGE